MPIYSYECSACGMLNELVRKIPDRADPVYCRCGAECSRIVESFTPDVFEPYYDEGLGSDVYSRSHRRAIMKELNVIEAGDKIHGGRNFDEKAPFLAEKRALIGKTKNPRRDVDDTIVSTVDADGNVLSEAPMNELPDSGEGASGEEGIL